MLRLLRALILIAAASLATAHAWAQQREPLLIPGTTSLHQRVLTRPGAILREAPFDAAAARLAQVPPLSMLFVYGRETVEGIDWMEVGTASTGLAVGWIRADTAIDWRQTLVLSFTNPVNRGRALFFHERDHLLDLIESETLVSTVDQLYAQVDAGTLPDNTPLVSIEPSEHVDLSEQFYLLPILDWTEAYFESGFSSLILQVAATSLREQTPVEQPVAGGPTRGLQVAGEVMKDYRAGIVFVVDTTTTMGVYLDRVREAVRKIYDSAAASEWGDRISFGLVGYRDVTETPVADDYIVRTFADLADGQSPDAFFEKVAAAAPADHSNLGYNEDAFAGISAAVQDIDWTGYDGRFVVLITDAGARGAGDALGATGLDAEQLRVMAQQKGIAIFALHLLTREGRHNHAAASAQYRALTEWPNIGDLYFGVEAGDVGQFGAAVDQLADQVVAQIAAAGEGAGPAAPPRPPDPALDQALAGFAERAALVGRAMQLAYLGRASGATTPAMFSAWVADRDLIDPSLRTVEVRVLITKNQLSQLQETLKAILEAGEATRITPTDFFNQLRSAAAAMSRRPEDVDRDEIRRLADVGLIGEYLEGLPYRSRIMELTEDDWLSWSFGQQREFLDGVEAKIQLYEDLHDDTDLWIALDGDRGGGEAVYPIQLDALP